MFDVLANMSFDNLSDEMPRFFSLIASIDRLHFQLCRITTSKPCDDAWFRPNT